MSRIKRFAVGTVVTAAVLGGSTMLWYQSHYVAPLVLPTPPPLPSPNGFDTLEQAENLQCYTLAQDTSLSTRQKLLAANKHSLEKTREALGQEYRVPPDTDPTHFPSNLRSYSSHQELLEFAVQTYAEAGNVSEAMRCALDSLEVVVMVPHGGKFIDRDDGNEYETLGRRMAWSLVEDVDANTARAAVARLDQIDARRWPLSESLREELQNDDFRDRLSVFRAGPAYAWEKMTVDSTVEQAATGQDFPALWRRAQAVYYGPQWVVTSIDDCVKRAQARFDSPWQPNRTDGIVGTSYSVFGYANKEMEEYFNRAHCALLKVSLAQRAYQKERGALPRSLEELVALGYLKTVPIDPFSPTHAPLGYKPDGTLWSVGPDAKDDGGKMFTQAANQRREQYPSGDLLPGKSIDAHSF